jgi:hypothetical protein
MAALERLGEALLGLLQPGVAAGDLDVSFATPPTVLPAPRGRRRQTLSVVG